MKKRMSLIASVFLALFISCASDDDDINLDPAENWETINGDYTYIYNIAGFGNMLYITGLKDGDFIFASSQDDGINWKDIVLNDDISIENGVPICVGFINSQEGFIGVKGSLTKQYLKTDDGGLTWDNFDINLSESCGYVPQPQQIVVIDESTLVISQFQSGNYIISRDGGGNWDCSTNFSVANSPKFIAFDANRYLNYDEGGIFESADQGSLWTTVLDASNLTTYEMYDQDLGLAITYPTESPDLNPQLYVTDDGWKSFETRPIPQLNEKLVVSIVSVSSEDVFFFESENIYSTSDGGETISLVKAIDFEPTHSKKVNGQWYVTGRGLARYNP